LKLGAGVVVGVVGVNVRLGAGVGNALGAADGGGMASTSVGLGVVGIDVGANVGARVGAANVAVVGAELSVGEGVVGDAVTAVECGLGFFMVCMKA